jgi:hypothetical protein
MVFPLALLQGLAGAAKGILPQGMSMAAGAAPAQAGALSAAQPSSLAMSTPNAPMNTPAPNAPAPSAPAPTNTIPEHLLGGGGAHDSGTAGSGSIAPVAGAVAGAGATTLAPNVAQAATPTATSDNNPEQSSWGAGINPYSRSSDWLTGGGGSHVMQGIVNRDPFAARGMEGDLGAYGINVPNTGSLQPSDVGLGGRQMSRDPNSAREAATGFGPTYGHTPTNPADAPWQGMGYGTPTPGYLSQGGSHQIDTGAPMPDATGASFSGITRNRADYGQGGPTVPGGTMPGGGTVAPPGVNRGVNRGFDPSPDPYLDPTGVLQEVFSGPDPVAAAPYGGAGPQAPGGRSGFSPSYGGYRGGTSPPGFLSGTGSSHYDPLSAAYPPVAPKGDFGGPNPFAGPLGDIFSPPSQQSIDQFAGGAGIAPPAQTSLPGFLEAGGTARTPIPRPAQPFDPRAPRPPQLHDALGPPEVPPPYADVGGPRVPRPRPERTFGQTPIVGISPFTPQLPPYGYPRPPRPRPDNDLGLRGSY